MNQFGSPKEYFEDNLQLNDLPCRKYAFEFLFVGGQMYQIYLEKFLSCFTFQNISLETDQRLLRSISSSLLCCGYELSLCR